MADSPKNALSSKVHKAHVFLLLNYFNDISNTFVYFKQENQSLEKLSASEDSQQWQIYEKDCTEAVNQSRLSRIES